MSNHSALSSEGAAPAINEELVWKKVVRRTLPLLMICYILAYLDRVNVSIAKLQMSSDLAFFRHRLRYRCGNIFFIGFFLFLKFPVI